MATSENDNFTVTWDNLQKAAELLDKAWNEAAPSTVEVVFGPGKPIFEYSYVVEKLLASNQFVYNAFPSGAFTLGGQGPYNNFQGPIEVSGTNYANLVMRELSKVCSALEGNGKDKVACPECNTQHNSVGWVIPHLNDLHRWTREQIADWLETLDVDLTIRREPVK